jgi:sulfate permease, SulP family
VNARAGAHTRAAGLVTAIVVALALTLLAGLFSKMTEATLGAIVLVAAAGLVRPNEFRRISSIGLRDGAPALVALGAVLLLGPLKGILAAVVLSMLTLLHEANRPAVSVREPEPGLLVVRPERSIYFASADRVHDAIMDSFERDSVRVLVLDGSAVSDLEYTGLEMLDRLRRELDPREIQLWFSALNDGPRAISKWRRRMRASSRHQTPPPPPTRRTCGIAARVLVTEPPN